VIDALEPAGAGAHMAMLEERKRKLGAEGLFEEARKKKLPFLPRVVGIVTSPTGAVIRDMLAGFRERFPARVLVWPVRVQGETSAAEVASAIRGFNALPPGGRIPCPDVLIVARGGGSLEDLWGFNEEIVVRAAAASRIPLISAVGHETDWTLIDLAADARAPTPTKAAEWAVPRYADLVDETEGLGLRLKAATRRHLEAARTHLKAAGRGLPRAEDLIALPRQRFDAVDRRLGRALHANSRAHGLRLARISSRLQPRLVSARIERGQRRMTECWQHARAALSRIAGQRRNRLERVGGRLRPQVLANRLDGKRRALEAQAGLLRSLGYRSVLARGFAVVRDEAGAMVRSAAAVTAGQRLEIELVDGRFAAEALDGGTASEPSRSSAQSAPAKPRARKGPKGGQGSLF
jgi:exodeoxyribonuclease VII large subunit